MFIKDMKAIDFLLEYACPSIMYRTKKEILKEILSKEEYENAQNQILQDEQVRHVLSLQKEDGWIGKTFHGEDEPESGIRLLCEKGVDSKNTALVRAIDAIENLGEEFDQGCLYRVGKLLDEANLGGSRMMKACVYAYAGIDNTDFMNGQIDKALAAFRFVITVSQMNDVYMEKNGKKVFNENVPWPSIYHLRLLAFTNSWKNDDNRSMMIHSLNRLCEFGTIPHISLLHKSQLISPGSFCMIDFDVKLEDLSAKEWMMWFHRIELIARLGVINDVHILSKQVDQLEEILMKAEGVFSKKLSHYYFNKWTPYLGLALENDWRKKNARICDLTFRSLLIMKLTGRLDL